MATRMNLEVRNEHNRNNPNIYRSVPGCFNHSYGGPLMFLSTNDNLAPWFKQFLWAHSMAPRHVRPAHMFYHLGAANKSKRPFRVWAVSRASFCAIGGLEYPPACSIISNQPTFRGKK